MNCPIIKVEGLGKEYVIGGQERGNESFREMLTSTMFAPFRRFRELSGNVSAEDRIWALKDISFEVEEGAIMGIIGHNGAGKSTLLKILSRITAPTEGRAKIRGRIASLLEVGTGFHPELTGRENIFLNGAILGMSRAEVARKFDEIVAFAGVEKFIDTPVKRYSSGMYVRLAFAVAAHLDADILIVDEVLAVGDHRFQAKCIERLSGNATSGKTVLFVSHNLAAVQNLCQRVLLLQSGVVILIDSPEVAISRYIENDSQPRAAKWTNRRGSGNARVDAVVTARHNTSHTTFQTGDPFKIAIDYESTRRHAEFCVHLVIRNLVGDRIGVLGTDYLRQNPRFPPIRGRIWCSIAKLPLMPGSYSVDIFLLGDGTLADAIEDVVRFEVIPGDYYGTGFLPPGSWAKFLLEHEWHLDAESLGRYAIPT